MQRYFSPHWYYAESVEQFKKDAANEEWLQRYLFDARKYYGDNGGEKEGESWPLTFQAMSHLLNQAEINKEQVVILEYRLDMHQRIDAIICGKNSLNEDGALLFEIKNWYESGPKFDLELSGSPNKIGMCIRGGIKDILHPSSQVEGYQDRLQSAQERKFFDSNNINLNSVVYLPSAVRISDEWCDVLRSGEHGAYVYDQDHEHKLIEYLKETVGHGSGISTLQKLIEISPMK